MEEVVDESAIKKFVHRVFRKANDIGILSVKSVREEFLQHRGIERLKEEEKELFKKIVLDLYALYNSKQQEQNDEQESVDEESETVESEDNSSFSSLSPRKKKRKIESDSDSDQGVTTHKGPPVECEINGNKGSNNSQKKAKGDTKKQRQVKHEVELDNSTYDEHESKNESSIKQRSRAGKNCNQSTLKETEQSNKDSNKTGKDRVSNEGSSDDEREETDYSKPELNAEDKFLESSSRETISKNEKDDHIVMKPKKQKAKADASENARKKKALLLTEDSTKLKNLKRHARSCGMHFRYVDIFADCKSMSQKEKILDKLIRDKTGFQGRITLKMCQKYKKKKEEADEVAALDRSNIIASDGGGRATRRATQRVSSSSTVPREEDASVFGRLRGTVDSDESGDEEITSKQTMGTTMDKGDNRETRKKRRRLDSSSEDDDDDNFV
ncbi:myb-like protein X isoform X2 [Acropora millepora]|uniref:myb-like protein X isoform X2 n=1 Tax=Acropora millepora TaxID=45264 RepID=UPI001CF2946A|nr:myb-like protein X isoform X2 [Acropora millepora]